VARVIVDGASVAIYMLAANDFAFDEYGPYLQHLADDQFPLQAPSGFPEALRKDPNNTTAVWFDFVNCVMWALTEEDMTRLTIYLGALQRK